MGKIFNRKIDLIESIKENEGYRSRPYVCPTGHWTIGYGFKILSLSEGEAEALFGMIAKNVIEMAKANDKAALGEIVISKETARAILNARLNDIWDKIESSKPRGYFNDLSNNLKYHLIEWAYQLGVGGIFKFKKAWAAIDDRDWDEAICEVMNSLWARQTPKRMNDLRSAFEFERDVMNG